MHRPQVVIEKEICIDNLLVRIHFIIVMIGWTGLAAWEFEFPFVGSLTSTVLRWSFVPGTCPAKQYYVAHEKPRAPLGPLQGPRHMPTVGS